MNRQTSFAALLAAQAAHSMEEYAGRLWETFPPVRFVSGLISPDLERNFVVLNLCLVALGVWCLVGPIGRGWPSARAIAWTWVAIELINGIVHPLWTLQQGRYTPGVATAPALLALAVYLGFQLHRDRTGIWQSP
jgi:hypothetical protein